MFIPSASSTASLTQQVLNCLFIQVIERKNPSPPQFVNSRVGEGYIVDLEQQGG